MSTTKSARSTIHRSFVRITALTVVVSLPLMGMAGIASAAKVKATAACPKHPHKKACTAGGGGATGGSGTAAHIIVSVSPDPVQESGLLRDRRHRPGLGPGRLRQPDGEHLEPAALPRLPHPQLALERRRHPVGHIGWHTAGVTGVTLDNDGNATVELQGENCAPGPNLVEADLAKSPYTTATATLTALPPETTPGPPSPPSPTPRWRRATVPPVTPSPRSTPIPHRGEPRLRRADGGCYLGCS